MKVAQPAAPPDIAAPVNTAHRLNEWRQQDSLMAEATSNFGDPSMVRQVLRLSHIQKVGSNCRMLLIPHEEGAESKELESCCYPQHRALVGPFGYQQLCVLASCHVSWILTMHFIGHFRAR